MKTNLFTTVILLMISVVSMAQFRGQITLGYASATGDLGDGANGGLGYAANLRYAFSDRFDAGLEYDANVLASIAEGLFSITGITAKAHFKLTNSKVHPYVALAIGVYSSETPEITITSGGTTTTSGGDTSSGFGFSPELGLNFGSFGIGAKYTSAGDLPNSSTKATYLKYFIGYSFSFGD